MDISVFDLFSIGIGPSSSHTVGPMKAACKFAVELAAHDSLSSEEARKSVKVEVELYGSLALTGVGHGTDKAVLLGLEGHMPDTIDPDTIVPRFQQIKEGSDLLLGGKFNVPFKTKTQLKFVRRKVLPIHPNGMVFRATLGDATLLEQTYYSIGGGFIETEESLAAAANAVDSNDTELPYPFASGDELLELSAKHNLSFAEMVMANEQVTRSKDEIIAFLDSIWKAMDNCIAAGCMKDGILPGGLKVKRRAKGVFEWLHGIDEHHNDPLHIIDWVNLYALAVNEENASGSRIVTAPTNGAAGIIPAVGKYYQMFAKNADQEGLRTYLLTCGAIGMLYKKNASISGAEVGCQGEVGVACSMAAGGLVAALGGTMPQVEQAAEIGMEHNLGLTCDPIGGLVQIPCIERNAMGAVKAINAARIAQSGNGEHFVSLDSVIKTMAETGKDMQSKYKETSRGGLAVNVPEC